MLRRLHVHGPRLAPWSAFFWCGGAWPQGRVRVPVRSRRLQRKVAIDLVGNSNAVIGQVSNPAGGRGPRLVGQYISEACIWDREDQRARRKKRLGRRRYDGSK